MASKRPAERRRDPPVFDRSETQDPFGGSRSPPAASLRVFLDFDGTLVEPNVAIELVGAFAPDGERVAHAVDIELHEGRLTLREAWERQAALLPADRLPEMTRYVVDRVPLREGAREFLDLIEQYQVPVVVLSGGLDFYIEAVLRRECFDVPFMADTLERTDQGTLRVLHPHGHPSCRLCGICKAQAVRFPLPVAERTVFIGDGSTDRYAAEVADIVFARRRLLTYCRDRGVPCYPFEGFGPVTRQMRAWLSGEEPLPEPRRIGLRGSACPVSDTLAIGEASGPGVTLPMPEKVHLDTPT